MKIMFPLICALALAACSTTTSWDATFGDSVRDSRAAQTLNPHASRNTSLGVTDGKAVVGAATAYADSYGYGVKDAPKTVVVQPTSK